ncbi:molybdate ABC transporter substrate-binding protein [Paeniglutamicibacter sp. ABSL32-1]|uniref:molybdate ABC transporter substrate-binding protein n=1 Tax=Paeniglutamicibacter quisquiliarum TaxID=2849498 RepID=UPI001C2D4219|nr:molybdate ABC transporter substrate-binding protein [Paeniglutamicibacter quisquiliarum]MBV1777562.1 molybdate ABC transporter substrate-binding protein [Paeniglutamicibacter quisquiliarum]
MSALRKSPTLLAAAILAAALAGCTSGTANNAGASGSSGGLSGEITVFAAASLKTTFTRLAGDFEAQHPGTKIALSFAGSSDLATQITAGAPADVFASADPGNMEKLSEAGLLDGAPRTFATNTLAIAVPPDNPASISTFADLAGQGVKVVICAPQVPCGTATKAVEESTKTPLAPVSEESSVTDVMGKVTSGEADAGLVYVTDILAAGDKVKGIKFPEAKTAVNTYPLATVATSPSKDLANAFTEFVAGPEGRKVLTDAGFGTP